MGFTRPRDLLAVALVAAVLAYLVVRLNYSGCRRCPGWPGWPRRWSASARRSPGSACAAGSGRGSEPRGGCATRKPVPPLTAARAVMAAKATSLAGAALAGLWLGLLAYVLPSWSVLAAAQADSDHRDHRPGRRADHDRRRAVPGALLPGTGRRSLTRPLGRRRDSAARRSSARPAAGRREQPAPASREPALRGNVFGLAGGGLDPHRRVAQADRSYGRGPHVQLADRPGQLEGSPAAGRSAPPGSACRPTCRVHRRRAGSPAAPVRPGTSRSGCTVLRGRACGVKNRKAS